MTESILTTENRNKIQKIWKWGHRRVTLQGRRFTMEHAKHPAYILLRGPDGTVGQVEKTPYSDFKSRDKEGRKLV